MRKMEPCCIFEKGESIFDVSFKYNIIKIYSLNQGYTGDNIRQLIECKQCGTLFLLQRASSPKNEIEKLRGSNLGMSTYIQVKSETEANKLARTLHDNNFSVKERPTIINSITSKNNNVSGATFLNIKEIKDRKSLIDRIKDIIYEEE